MEGDVKEDVIDIGDMHWDAVEKEEENNDKDNEGMQSDNIDKESSYSLAKPTSIRTMRCQLMKC